MAAPGLLNLRTDLKSLRYGSDKPYVTEDINNPPSSNQTGMQITKRIDDLSRISQMLIDRPGLKFIGNQALLQQVDIQDKLQKSRDNGKTFAGALLQQGLSTVKQTAKILGSTIAQVPVNGTGTHFVYAFRTDTYLQPSGGNNRTAFAQFFGAGGVEGAPLALKGAPIEGVVQSKFGDTVQATGEFRVTADSELDYDDKTNTQIPAISQYIYAKEGTSIVQDNIGQEFWKPYTSTGVGSNLVDRDTNKVVSGSVFVDKQVQEKPRSPITGSVRNTTSTNILYNGQEITIPGAETTKTPGTLGISNQNVKPTLASEAVQVGKFKVDESKTKTTKSTEDNIRNATTGSAIALKGGVKETTAAIKGSRSNKDVPFDIAENSTNNVGETIYSSGNTYTGTSTQDAINAAVGGTTVHTNKLSGSYRPLDPNTAANTQRSYKPFGDPTPISGISETDETQGPTTDIIDFRKEKGNSYSFDYNSPTINRERRVNLGNQGKAFVKNSYTDSDPLTIDTLNELDIQVDDRAVGSDQGRDFAKFYFEIITPETKQFLHFRAFIDSIDDSYNADWQGTKYVGRAENFYTYGGFERDINISFKIAAATRAEMKPLYRKMVFLASSTAPTYGGQGFMRGTLARLTVGSYFSQLPGVITSVKYSLIQDMPWEISMQNPEAGTDDDMQELPMGLQCSVSYKVIHDFAPQTGLYHYFTSPNPLNGSTSFLK